MKEHYRYNIDLKSNKTIKSYSSLLSALEYSLAGAKADTPNINLYLNNALQYHNLLNAFYRYNSVYKYYDYVYHAANTCYLYANKIQGKRNVIPSIVLNKDIKFISVNGTKSNPYTIE